MFCSLSLSLCHVLARKQNVLLHLKARSNRNSDAEVISDRNTFDAGKVSKMGNNFEHLSEYFLTRLPKVLPFLDILLQGRILPNPSSPKMAITLATVGTNITKQSVNKVQEMFIMALKNAKHPRKIPKVFTNRSRISLEMPKTKFGIQKCPLHIQGNSRLLKKYKTNKL